MSFRSKYSNEGPCRSLNSLMVIHPFPEFILNSRQNFITGSLIYGQDVGKGTVEDTKIISPIKIVKQSNTRIRDLVSKRKALCPFIENVS